ncbi:MAG: hypothetical protein RL311_146 [Bacteroidota bacterium]|jgi:hypothetical protein
MNDADKLKSGCESKLQFTTKDAVVSHIKILNKVGILDFYTCAVCKMFHTTTFIGKNTISEKREHSRQKRASTENRIKKMR